MTKTGLFLLFLASWTLSAEAEIARPYFYRVSKGAEVHYLLGTYHTVIQWNDLPSRVHKALEKSSTVVTETEYDDQWNTILKMTFDDLSVSGESIWSEAEQLKLRQIGVPERLIPTLADDNCTAALFYPHIEKYPFYQVDADIYLRAKSAGKKMVRLDTAEILSVSRGAEPAENSSCSVRGILTHMTVEQISAIGRLVVDDYRSGDLDKKPHQADWPLVYRNRMWMPTLMETLRKDSSFVVVGVSHLWGETGLIRLLRMRGYVILRL